MSLSRPGFLFLLILQWGPVQGASSDAVSFETNLTSIDDAAADLAGSVVENGDDFALPNDAWLDNWPLSQVMPSPSMVPAVSIHRSDGGNANVSGWQMATSSSESRSSVAMPGSLVALIFGAFGLLFVTRRGVFR